MPRGVVEEEGGTPEEVAEPAVEALEEPLEAGEGVEGEVRLEDLDGVGRRARYTAALLLPPDLLYII